MQLLFILLLGLSIGPNSLAIVQNDRVEVYSEWAYMASPGQLFAFAQDCIYNRYTQPTLKYAQSMETLIDLIERLEDVLANTTDPNLKQLNSAQDVARLLLHRFYLDGVDMNNNPPAPRLPQEKRVKIDTIILGGPGDKVQKDTYYFPDNIYNEGELCDMFFMFSHIFLNNSAKANLRKRDTYNFQRTAVSSSNLPLATDANLPYPIQEKGVVSFRLQQNEAISPGRVLIGVLAGLNKNFVTAGSTIAQQGGIKQALSREVTLKDPVLTVTLANQGGSSTFYNVNTKQNMDYVYFGISGHWVNSSCCTYYAITDPIKSVEDLWEYNRGSMAEILGGIDGYLIGSALRQIDATNLKLSTILKSYYTKPRSGTVDNQLGVSYCDRSSITSKSSDLSSDADAYNVIFNAFASFSGTGLTNKISTFNSALQKAAQVQDEMCRTRPSGSYDSHSSCETPSDLIFVIDPKSERLNQTARVVSDIISKINKIGKYSGTVSVFAASNTRSSVILPNGPGSWPLGAIVFNSTEIGSVPCRILDPRTSFPPLTSLGKFVHELNQTIFNYKWWTPRRFFQGVPSKNVIIIDYDTLQNPTINTDKDDYRFYSDSLRYRNRDVRYLVVADNPDRFSSFIDQNNKDKDIVSSTTSDIGNTFEKRICDNPATLIYNDCAQKTSDGVAYEGFITPGYRQHWAMYPEYFLKSYNIEIKVKAIDGEIKYCYDRSFPPERQDQCKDLQVNGENTIHISNPCEDQSVHSCRPFYFTVWGKKKTTVCKENPCLSLDQIKFSITHKGISCNSAVKLGAIIFLQLTTFILVLFNYFRFV